MNCYKDWVMVRGFQSDGDPQEGQPFSVKSLWLRDFAVPPDQPGANVLVSADEFLSSYLRPLSTPVPSDPYNGRYVVVVEPPAVLNPWAEVESGPPSHALPQEAHDALEYCRRTAGAADDHGLSVTVENGRERYWLVPFRAGGSGAQRRAVLARGSGRAFEARSCTGVLAVGSRGVFRAYSWTDAPTPVLRVDKRKAELLLWGRLREWPEGRLTLVRRAQDSPFRPSWRYETRRGGVAYVSQLGSVEIAACCGRE
jgi:hypothetical protein